MTAATMPFSLTGSPEHEAFRDAVLGKESDIVTMRQGLATVAVAEAAIRSALDGVVVTL